MKNQMLLSYTGHCIMKYGYYQFKLNRNVLIISQSNMRIHWTSHSMFNLSRTRIQESHVDSFSLFQNLIKPSNFFNRDPSWTPPYSPIYFTLLMYFICIFFNYFCDLCSFTYFFKQFLLCLLLFFTSILILDTLVIISLSFCVFLPTKRERERNCVTINVHACVHVHVF